jgi:hypothetical protein
VKGYHAYRNGEWVHTLDPRVEILTRGDKVLVRLLETIAYVDSRDVWHYTHKGRVSDGGSKPPIVWPVFGHPFGRYLMAYLQHDDDYREIRELLMSGQITFEQAERMRRESDRRFREGMEWIRRNSGFGRVKNTWHRFKAGTKYRFVRVFGGRSVNNKTGETV